MTTAKKTPQKENFIKRAMKDKTLQKLMPAVNFTWASTAVVGISTFVINNLITVFQVGASVFMKAGLATTLTSIGVTSAVSVGASVIGAIIGYGIYDKFLKPNKIFKACARQGKKIITIGLNNKSSQIKFRTPDGKIGLRVETQNVDGKERFKVIANDGTTVILSPDGLQKIIQKDQLTCNARHAKKLGSVKCEFTKHANKKKPPQEKQQSLPVVKAKNLGKINK